MKNYVCDNVLVDNYGSNVTFYQENGEAQVSYTSDDFVCEDLYSPANYKTEEEALAAAREYLAEDVEDEGFSKEEAAGIAEWLVDWISGNNWIGFKWEEK